jgi:hypothetical protein
MVHELKACDVAEADGWVRELSDIGGRDGTYDPVAEGDRNRSLLESQSNCTCLL